MNKSGKFKTLHCTRKWDGGNKECMQNFGWEIYSYSWKPDKDLEK
jgi:hypothetical protein